MLPVASKPSGALYIGALRRIHRVRNAENLGHNAIKETIPGNKLLF